MAHPYTTRSRLQVAAIARRLSALVDRDEDGLEDSGVLASLIERACNHIDAKLGKRFEVPFASSSGVATDGTIADLSDRMTLALVLEPIDYERYLALKRDVDAELAQILAGELYVNAPLVSGDARRRGVGYESAGTIVAGRIGDDYSDSGVDKSRGI